jgi:putative transposase
MYAELLRKFKELERENSELKLMYADLSLDHRILKNMIEKSCKAFSEEANCQ